MHDDDIYVKTDAGRDEIRSRTVGLPMSVRAILLMIDGQRNVAAVRQVIAGSKAPADVLDQLVAQGLIVPADGSAAGAALAPAIDFAATAVLEPPSAPPEPPAPAPRAPIAPVEAEPPASLHMPNRHAASGSPSVQDLLRDIPLDIVLPTILVPDPQSIVDLRASTPMSEPFIDEPTPVRPTAGPASASSIPPVPVPLDRYEHLYQMMNEIVRDFLSPTRRYFFQLKIERATTADELLELLKDLRTALAKSRGDAFASEVIARLRNAAG
jgi:hypothetical protein